jgi:diaminopimelate epimerase
MEPAAGQPRALLFCHGAPHILGAMRFTKMHGIGNDYVYVNTFEERVHDPASLARRVSDRHFGIGSDGLILICPPTQAGKADVRMRMFNVDGSEGEMCGNGVRCVAKYAFDHGLTDRIPMRVETGRGVLSLDLKLGALGKVDQVTVNMGEPRLALEQIPVDPAHVVAGSAKHEYLLKVPVLGIAAEKYQRVTATFANVGNPHAVIFSENVDTVALAEVGPILECHPAFPQRANIHWAQVISRNELKMRTWERGSGITWACGTGASAVCVAGVLTGRTNRDVVMHLPGGDLRIEWRESDNAVYMTGPATEVFSGELSEEA